MASEINIPLPKTLFELFNDLTGCINNVHSVDLITIDFSKAFDSTSHNKLIHKLKTFGICGKILLWIKEFLNNRSFAIKLNNLILIMRNVMLFNLVKKTYILIIALIILLFILAFVKKF